MILFLKNTTTKPLTQKRMGKYLKQGFVRALEWQHAREEISHSKMVELMEEECIKNYKEEMLRASLLEQVNQLSDDEIISLYDNLSKFLNITEK